MEGSGKSLKEKLRTGGLVTLMVGGLALLAGVVGDHYTKSKIISATEKQAYVMKENERKQPNSFVLGMGIFGYSLGGIGFGLLTISRKSNTYLEEP